MDGESFVSLPLGSIDSRLRRLRARVPRALCGGIVAAIQLRGLSTTVESARFGDVERRDAGGWPRLADLGGWQARPTSPYAASLVTVGSPRAPIGVGAKARFAQAGPPFIRAPFELPSALPAIAGSAVPDGANGRIAVRVRGFEIPVQIVGRSDLIPTVVDAPHRLLGGPRARGGGRGHRCGHRANGLAGRGHRLRRHPAAADRARGGRRRASASAPARPDALPGGEQQRVAVCAALAKRPALLLADEPTGELDARNCERVVDRLPELSADAGASGLIVTHDPTVVERARRTIHLRDRP